MGRSDKQFEGKDVVIGIGWYAAGIASLFLVGLLLSWVVRL